MTKFYEYLNESNDINDYMEKISRDCLPFLKDLKKNGYNFLYSGRNESEKIIKKKIRKNRHPMDTPIEIHNLLDDLFNKKFGIKARSESMFVKSNKDVSFYGDSYFVFPVGNKYSFIYSDKISDLFVNIKEELENNFQKIPGLENFYGFVSFKNFSVNIKKHGYIYISEYGNSYNSISDELKKENVKITYEDYLKIVKMSLNNLVDTYKKYNNTRFIDYSSSNEIMLNCNEVWLLKYDQIYEFKIKTWIDKNI